MEDKTPPKEQEVSNQSQLTNSQWRELYLKEDYWAIWFGFLLIGIGLILFLLNPPEGMRETIAEANEVMRQEAEVAPFKTIAWHQASESKNGLKVTNQVFAKVISQFTATPSGWKNNPLDGFVLSEEKAEARREAAAQAYEEAQTTTAERLTIAEAAEEAARTANFEDETLNQTTKTAIADWQAALKAEASAKTKASVRAYNHINYLIGFGIILALFFSIGIYFMGQSVQRFVPGFLFIFFIAILAYLFANQTTMKTFGIGYAAWAILFGLIISNTIGTPKWVLPAVQTEYFIKTGLVLLGAEILFGKILAIGLPGIFVAWVVTPIVLISTYIFGQKVLKIPSKTLNMTVSADMSVCGVSAAIATAAACKAKKEELTLAVGLSLVFTSIMMIVMPNFILLINMDEILGGAWIGGTIDATGAVAAAGAFLGERALYVAATIKMIQNVLIGVIAFGVAIYWSYKVDRQAGSNVTAWEIWYRFPKFVIGFIGASIIFSLLYQWMGTDVGNALIDNGVLRGFTKSFRGWFFCLAFVSIGLATNFRELSHYFAGGKPLILYVCGQTFNLILTLIMAYIMFYLVFPDVVNQI